MNDGIQSAFENSPYCPQSDATPGTFELMTGDQTWIPLNQNGMGGINY